MDDNLIKVEELVAYARRYLELDERNSDYIKNRLLEIFESGKEGVELEDSLYGELSLMPARIDERFSAIKKTRGSKSATDWFYDYCVKNKYVKKEMLDKNPRFDCSNGLIVTINKAKPEFRDPKKAKAGNSVDGGFAKCVICRENEGFGARNKRNLRTVSLSLGGKSWFWQYSPYGYFHEHGIAVNEQHIPMHVDRNTFAALFDFVDEYPHYFIGCNAPLPRIGGSVLAHDHYQGGGETLPLQKAKIRTYLQSKLHSSLQIGILDWPGTVIRIIGKSREEITDVADCLRVEWERYSDIRLGIVAKDENGVHNAISPTVCKTQNGYEMNIILRSNITSEEYPDGIFHAHPEFHSIKKESIGLIEAQGLFILPGRLETELGKIEEIIETNKSLPEGYEQFSLVYEETKALYKSGNFVDVHKAMQEELGSTCYRILQNTAVFKEDADLLKFLETAGIEK